MKIKCINIINPVTNEIEQESDWLTIGKEYIVLEIKISFGKKPAFLCLSDDNSTPIMFDMDQFEIVCNKIPSNWVIYFDKFNYMSFAPAKWLREGFWLDYYDLDTKAFEEFKSESEKIISESI